MSLPTRIKEIRKLEKLTQKDFGKRLTLSQSQIAGYENGTTSIPNRVINQISKEFSVNTEWLINGNGEIRTFDTNEMELSSAIAKISLSDDPILKELTQKLTKLDSEYLVSINNLIDVILKKEQP